MCVCVCVCVCTVGIGEVDEKVEWYLGGEDGADGVEEDGDHREHAPLDKAARLQHAHVWVLPLERIHRLGALLVGLDVQMNQEEMGRCPEGIDEARGDEVRKRARAQPNHIDDSHVVRPIQWRQAHVVERVRVDWRQALVGISSHTSRERAADCRPAALLERLRRGSKRPTVIADECAR